MSTQTWTKEKQSPVELKNNQSKMLRQGCTTPKHDLKQSKVHITMHRSLSCSFNFMNEVRQIFSVEGGQLKNTPGDDFTPFPNRCSVVIVRAITFHVSRAGLPFPVPLTEFLVLLTLLIQALPMG